MTARTEAFSNSDNLIADVHLAPATMSSAKRVKLSHSKAPGPFRKPSSGDRAAAKVLTKKITQAPKAAAPIKQRAREAEEDDDDDEDDEDEEDEEQNGDSSDEASENDDSTPTVEEATKEGQTELPSKEETPTKSFRDLVSAPR